MSKRFSLAKVQAAENFNRWNKSRIWKNTGTFVRKVHSNWKRKLRKFGQSLNSE